MDARDAALLDDFVDRNDISDDAVDIECDSGPVGIVNLHSASLTEPQKFQRWTAVFMFVGIGSCAIAAVLLVMKVADDRRALSRRQSAVHNFDCSAGRAHCAVGWSPVKKAWCANIAGSPCPASSVAVGFPGSQAHGYSAPSRGTCVDTLGRTPFHMAQSGFPHDISCRDECDIQLDCQGYSYDPGTGVCLLYGPLDIKDPAWKNGVGTPGASCPTKGSHHDYAVAENSFVSCHMKVHLEFEKLGYNVPGCSAATAIPTLLDCESAHRSLGLKYIPIYSGNTSSMPRYCSVREDVSGTNGEHLHWNIAAAGTGRPDLAPVCYKSTVGCPWPRPTTTTTVITETNTVTATTTTQKPTTTTPTAPFIMLTDGDPGCPAGTEIFTQEVCRDAIEELGLDPSPSFQGKWQAIPRFCSYVSQASREHMHFNTDDYGRGHAGYSPVCYASPGRDFDVVLPSPPEVHYDSSQLVALQHEVASLKEEQASLLHERAAFVSKQTQLQALLAHLGTTQLTTHLWPTTTSMAPTTRTTRTTTSEYPAGWYPSVVDENCGLTCAKRGLVCTENGLFMHNDEVDDPTEVQALMYNVAGVDLGAACTSAFGNRLDVPGWSATACLSSAHTRPITQFDCGSGSLQPGSGFRRLCYCHEFDASVSSWT